MDGSEIFEGGPLFNASFKICEAAIRRAPQGRHRFFDNSDFPWTQNIEAGWRDIRAELDEVLEDRENVPAFQHLEKKSRGLSQDQRWQAYFLYGFGEWVEENCARCPETQKLLQQIPGLQLAFFSILAPRKHLPMHRGPYNGVLRYHLGLKVPEDAASCKIEVGGEQRCWQEGESMIFDDSHPHQVWNETDETRVVLFVDLVRPLPAPVSWMNRAFLGAIERSQYVQDGRERMKSWGGLPRVGEPAQNTWLSGPSVDLTQGASWIVAMDPEFEQLSSWFKVLGAVHARGDFPDVVVAMATDDARLDALRKEHEPGFEIARLESASLAALSAGLPPVIECEDGKVTQRWLDGVPAEVLARLRQPESPFRRRAAS